jgi:hypothetical protein
MAKMSGVKAQAIEKKKLVTNAAQSVASDVVSAKRQHDESVRKRKEDEERKVAEGLEKTRKERAAKELEAIEKAKQMEKEARLERRKLRMTGADGFFDQKKKKKTTKTKTKR